MSSVDQAADYASRLLQNEARGPGDTEPAMHRIEAKYGVPYWTQWALRYRRPKSITVDAFNRVQSAYWAACERQLASAAHAVALAQAAGGDDDDDSDLVAEAESLVAKIKARRAMK